VGFSAELQLQLRPDPEFLASQRADHVARIATRLERQDAPAVSSRQV